MLQEYTSTKLMKTPLIERNLIVKKKTPNKLSPYFLFEASGDSEGDFDYNHQHSMMTMMGLHDHYSLDNHDDNNDNDNDDDAQSCSYDASHVNDASRGRSASYRTHSNNNHVVVHDDDDSSEVGSYTSNYKGYCTSEVVSTANSHDSSRRSKSCVDSNQGKKMNEEERSRLFWETCLAS